MKNFSQKPATTVFLTVVLVFFLQNVARCVTPIARYDVVPFQRINAGETLNVGVVAFSKAGIDRVEFTVTGQGYSGTNPLVTKEMTLNPRTGIYEYWVPVSADEFSSDGQVQIEAVVYGKDKGMRDKNWLINDELGTTYTVDCWHTNDGHYEYYCTITGTGMFNESMIYSNVIIFDQEEQWWNGLRVNVSDVTKNTITFNYAKSYGSDPVNYDYQPKTGDGFILSRGFGLDPLVLTVNPMKTLPDPVAYVDLLGNDESGAVNNPELPYLTLGGAMVGLRDWMNDQGYGNRINGTTVRMNPGTHEISNGGFWQNIISRDEWFTITSNRSLDGNRDNTILTGGGIIPTDFIKVEDVTIIPDELDKDVIGVSTAYQSIFKLWVEDCHLEGNTKYTSNENPVSSKFIWYTNSFLTYMGKAVSEAQLARNITIEEIGDDAFVRSPFVVNCRANDVDPRDGVCEGGGCAHADCWQWWGQPVPNNAIIYGLDCQNCAYQGLFARTQDGNTPLGFQNPPAEGVAIINLHTQLSESATFADNSWYISTNHMLLWHSSFNQDFNFWNDGDAITDDYPLNIIDFDVQSNLFYDVELNADLGDDNGGDPDAPGIEIDSWAHNHFKLEAGSKYWNETPGTDVSVGDPMVDDWGRPVEGSPLIDRRSSVLVYTDADNRTRDVNPDIGAFEYGSGVWIAITESEKEILMYPNPFSELLFIGCNTSVQVTVLNISGEIVYVNDISNSVNIDLNFLSEGIYFVQLNSLTNREIRMVVKL